MKKRVLIVEDSEIVAKVEKFILSSLDCDIDWVMTGEEGVESSKKSQYDLILMDLGLPGIDGKEATQQIRAANSEVNNSETPIVAVTANDNLDEHEKCLQVGMNDVVCKPLTPDKAREIISSYCSE